MGSGSSKPIDSSSSGGVQPPPSPSSGGCPVKHDVAGAAATPDASAPPPEESKCPMHNADGSYSYDWSALFRPNFPHRPGSGTKPLSEQEARAKITRRATVQDGAMASPAGGCPVATTTTQTEYNVYSQPLDPKNNMPRVANQLPAAQQSQSLSTHRVSSSIPKGGAAEGTTWTYPSPQMFYNSLARKNKLGDTAEHEMESVVALHNNMNEKTWTRVQQWEAVLTHNPSADSAPPPPKLLKFMGRPTDLSPKAMFKHYILGHPLPYDRHDWTILRTDGTTVRYVIDYYYDESRARDDAASATPALRDTTATPSLIVDVRPALDSPTHLWNRVVTMPWAQFQQQTTYEYLPLRPTTAMKSQVQESVQVWASIQAAAGGGANAKEEDKNDIPKLTKRQAAKLVKDMKRAVQTCKQQQERLNACQTDEDCTKASLNYTLCLSKPLCPVQHDAFTKALHEIPSDTSEAQIEAALEVVQTCVVQKTAQRQQARTDFGL